MIDAARKPKARTDLTQVRWIEYNALSFHFCCNMFSVEAKKYIINNA